MKNKDHTKAKKGCFSIKGCLIPVAIIVGLIALFFYAFGDDIKKDTAEAHTAAKKNTTELKTTLQKLYVVLKNEQSKDTLLHIPKSHTIHQDSVLYITMADLATIAQAKDSTLKVRHLEYDGVEKLIEVLDDSVRIKNAFEVRKITQNALSKTYAFVPNTFLFIKPKLFDPPKVENGKAYTFDAGFAMGRTYVVDLKTFDIIGFSNFKASNSDLVQVKKGFRSKIRFKKLRIPLKSGGESKGKAIAEDFYHNLDSVVRHTWTLMQAE